MSRLQESYQKTIRPHLKSELTLTNLLAVPKVLKVAINVGVGEAKDQAKLVEHVITTLSKITGQKAVITKARQSIAGFKIRQGQTVGVRVTLRGERMYDFLDKLTNVTLPRLRDFRGLSRKGFDGNGNYNLGIREHIIFPEIHFDTTEKVYGFNITIVTSAKTNEAAMALLEQFGFPFEKE